jgi:methionyl aminopeptidase
MIIIKTPEEVAQMRAACRMAAKVRDSLSRMVSPGTTTADLDQYAADLLKGFGAKSAFLGYRGFPGNICVSVNEEVVHGIPGNRRIQLGDVVSLDVGVMFDGFVGDTATTVMVGVTDPEVVRLVTVAQRALDAGIDQARAGGRVSDISHAIEKVVTGGGFSVVRDFVGHGVGRSMHEDPQVPNFGPPGRGAKLKAGMTLALEPMVNAGGSEVKVMDNGWTVVTADRSPSAHVEHTVAIREDGAAEILTVADDR